MVFVKSYIQGLMILKFRKRMVSCINLQCSISEKQIFSQVFDKSIRTPLNAVWKKKIIFGDFKREAENKVKKDFLLDTHVLQYEETEHMF